MDSTQVINKFRFAIERGQAFLRASTLQALINQLVDAMCQMCAPQSLQVYLLNDDGQLTLQADGCDLETTSAVNGKPVDTAVALTNALQVRQIIQIEDDDSTFVDFYVPILFEDLPIGAAALRIDADVDGETQAAIAQALEVMAGFAACRLVAVKPGSTEQAGAMHNISVVSNVIAQTRRAAQSELSAAMAHQLSNPLTTIVADAEILLMDVEEGTRLYRSLAAIHRSGRRATEVVRRLTASADQRILGGQSQPVDLVKNIKDVLDLVHRYLEVDNIEVLTTYPSELPLLWAAPDMLGDVWLNLVMNARDAIVGHESGKIGIDVHYAIDEGLIAVSVWDNGRGIPKQDRKAIFQPFYTTRSAERIGLGLHSSQQVVQGLGGEITVMERDGGGALFKVSLPVKKGN